VQLRRALAAVAECEIVLVTVNEAYRHEADGRRFYAVNDATRWSPLGILLQAVRVLRIVLRERPDVVLSTGAAPGCLAVVFGSLLGARTIWLDSIANVERLSVSGRLVRRFVDLWLTQWPHLASEHGPEYAGRVL